MKEYIQTIQARFIETKQCIDRISAYHIEDGKHSEINDMICELRASIILYADRAAYSGNQSCEAIQIDEVKKFCLSALKGVKTAAAFTSAFDTCINYLLKKT